MYEEDEDDTEPVPIPNVPSAQQNQPTPAVQSSTPVASPAATLPAKDHQAQQAVVHKVWIAQKR